MVYTSYEKSLFISGSNKDTNVNKHNANIDARSCVTSVVTCHRVRSYLQCPTYQINIRNKCKLRFLLCICTNFSSVASQTLEKFLG